MSAEVHIIGKSKHAEQLRKLIAKLSESKKDALIVGEIGVGKSTAASLIAFDENPTTFQMAHQDEIELQTRLAAISRGTVLFEDVDQSGFRNQEIMLGFIAARPKAIRVIVTVSESTEKLLLQQKLTESLCAGLSTFEKVEIRPLRERPEDIPLLVKHFANGLVIDINTLGTLVRLPWNENVRQLKSIVERCISSAQDGRFVLPEELVDERTEVAKMVSGLMESQKPMLDKSLDVIENTIIRRTLERFGFDESKAAKFLGMTEHVFGQRVKRLALVRPSSR
jgi:DNA-binding NtrC family response regulator